MPLTLLVPTVLVGLVFYAALTRIEPRGGYFRLLGGFVLLAMLAGLFVLRIVPLDADAAPGRALMGLGALYLGWVGLAAYGVQAMRRRAPDLPGWAAWPGALAVLVPLAGWGLAGLLSGGGLA